MSAPTSPPAPSDKQPDRAPRAAGRSPARSVIYGRHPVAEALRAGAPVRRLWLAVGQRPAPILDEVVSLARAVGVDVTSTSRDQLDRMTVGGHHQGVAIELAPGAGRAAAATLESLLAKAAEQDEAPLLLVLDHLQDPQNLGALLRTAEAAGAHGVIMPSRRSAGLTPGAIRASAGAAAFIAVAEVANLSQSLDRLKAQGVWVVGLAAEASTSYDAVDLTVPLALVVGTEGAGLGQRVAGTCDILVRIPMHGRVASLNASVAGAILLYEAVRQRRGKAEGWNAPRFGVTVPRGC